MIELKLTGNLRWAVFVLAVLLVVTALGCSGEPEVIVKEVHVVVTATPVPAPQATYTPLPTYTPYPTATPQSQATPTPAATSRLATPVPTPTPVWNDYYSLVRSGTDAGADGWGSIEYFADFPESSLRRSKDRGQIRIL